jgi:putative transposase
MMTPSIFKTPLHTPAHLFQDDSISMVTASTYKKHNFMESDERKEQWQNAYFKACELYQWHVIAWVVLNNHYHLMMRSPEQNGRNLPKLIASLHKFTARQWNDDDKQSGRKIWWNYWDTCIRSEKDFENRLNYVFWNPVKHGLVSQPEEYEFSNYRYFLKKAIYLSPLDPTIEVNDVPEF